jgi:hypothetical protein
VLSGRLEDLALPDILQLLQVSGKTGGLYLSRPSGDTGLVVFQAGQILQVFCSEGYLPLGRRFLAAGALTVIQERQALAHMVSFTGLRFGDALVDLGFVAREIVENEVRRQMAEALDRLMTWTDADFAFRVGIVTPGRSIPESASDYVLPDGVDAKHILLEAAVLGDNLIRDRRGPAALATSAEIDAQLDDVLSHLDCVSPIRPEEFTDAEALRVAKHFLHYSEQLLAATKQREMTRALLDYARQIFQHGAIVLCSPAEYRVVELYGTPFAQGVSGEPEPAPAMARGRSPLFDAVVADRAAYAGLALLESSGLSPVAPSCADGTAVLVIPLLVVGRVLLIVFCRGALAGGPDARSLIVLAQHASVAIENLALKKLVHESKTPFPKNPIGG